MNTDPKNQITGERAPSHPELTSPNNNPVAQYEAILHFTQPLMANVLIEAHSPEEATQKAYSVAIDDLNFMPPHGERKVDSVTLLGPVESHEQGLTLQPVQEDPYAALFSRGALSNLAFEFLRLHDAERPIVWSKFPRSWALRRCPEEQRLEKVFQILLAQNVRAVRRCHGASARVTLNRALDWNVMEPSENYRQRPVNAPALIDLCECYERLTEDKHYGRTEAAWILRMTREAATRIVLDQHRSAFGFGQPLDGFVDDPTPSA